MRQESSHFPALISAGTLDVRGAEACPEPWPCSELSLILLNAAKSSPNLTLLLPSNVPTYFTLEPILFPGLPRVLVMVAACLLPNSTLSSSDSFGNPKCSRKRAALQTSGRPCISYSGFLCRLQLNNLIT
ncbi:hypothetical protein EYF80_032486 [Liparis tanakae]|uniref:Uncharacterized protein n=1 Tax=Liparis tanakae TaxID=230148 RepID=A0A4Z2GUL5_9TELE|nr:hypothetical protein EYF80_032486 [Liparis tanakae]